MYRYRETMSKELNKDLFDKLCRVSENGWNFMN